jgi:hypothetical protein
MSKKLLFRNGWARVPGDLILTGHPKDQGSKMSPEEALAIPRERHYANPCTDTLQLEEISFVAFTYLRNNVCVTSSANVSETENQRLPIPTTPTEQSKERPTDVQVVATSWSVTDCQIKRPEKTTLGQQITY